MGVIYQVISAMIICSTVLNVGVTFMWPAFTILLFSSERTPLHRPMTVTEISLLGSLSSMGSVLSTMTAGFLLDKLGRKKCCLASALCVVIFWSVLVVSRRVEAVLLAVFISGLSNSVILISSVYISEFSQDSIRGSLCAAILTFNSIGFVVSYLLGGFLEYKMMLYIGLSISVFCMSLLFFLKDSPSYLMMRGREKESMQALAFYRNLKIDDQQVIDEINILRRNIKPTVDNEVQAIQTELTPEMEKLNTDVKPVEKLSTWQFLKKSKSTRRALFINLVMLTAGIYQGQIIILVYIEQLFLVAVPSISPSLSSVFLAIARVGAGFLAGYLSDISGRRPLMIHGSLVAAINAALLGTQMQFNWGPSWIAAMSIFLFSIAFTIGAGTMPLVLASEMFLPEVKSILSMVCCEWIWICNFSILFIFNPVLKAIGWGPVFYIFASLCLLTAIFCFFFLPETKGLTAEEIQPLVLKKANRTKL
ncbi:unnamed protein product [Arctia plantaginis]|uniref:Major facilitator superfamily (MFS) profile domain-containing protein n=1 Tax=Arctia plantaginis TaxID=874455 RepID=A0A8S1AJ19_ARCPL|nr:unnamed protein product [Arctia plantaginis]